MAIRQSPDNPCIIESSVDGTNWCPFIDLSLCQNFGSQPGPTPPPTPGGGTQQTCSQLKANQTLLLPLLVNAGDTIQLNNASGAWWDGGSFDFGPLWQTPNGNQFIGGIEYPVDFHSSTDPIPSAKHMTVIAGIGATPIYLALAVGVPVTVPAGVSNAQIWLQCNDDPIDNNQGTIDFCVTVTNNQSGTTVNVDYPVAGTGPVSMILGTEYEIGSTVWFNGSFNENLLHAVFSLPVRLEVVDVTGWTAFPNLNDYLGGWTDENGASHNYHQFQAFDPAVTWDLASMVSMATTSSTPWTMHIILHAL